MPLSSTEIAAMNGSFQGQAMNNLAYSSMIGQGGNVYGGGGGYRGAGAGGDRAMGSAMGMAGAVGAPLMSGAMGLLGLDPMSMGLKAGMSAFGSGAGLGGAALAGGAVALPLMAAGAAVSYAGGQMFEGASQQSNLNAQLRSSFNFQNRQGGTGFSRSDMTSIGSAVREMSEQFGPGGEIASFKELSGLAGKMGQMGFAQGVRDVKDFTSRFKEMVKSLKTMATDLGTTLEGAMEFAQAAKSSGVFGANRAVGFTAAARQATVSGGLALSEVTGAASIGSQISRSMGGLGRQGAMAGVRTIGQIGTAQQMGILSEEDIYNVTGQTGAEGRQAYAASSMATSAKFLQSGRGRRMLASMAGKGGSLDEDAVQQILTGGMGISETMRQDRAHVTGPGAAVSRANFIRNEGRLRGAAMERLGGFLPALQLQEWAASKGVDINDMDDRSMLFAQRQLGMGRDEVDQAVKMANAMPQILERERRSSSQDQYFQALSTARKGQGIEGVKQKFEQAKELINGKLQKAGQDIFNAGSEAVDTFFNKLFGTYVETYSKDIDDNYRSMRGGGAMGAAAGSKAFGIGGSTQSQAFRAAVGGGKGVLGRAGGEDLATAMFRGNWGDVGMKAGASQLKEAGYDIRGMTSEQISSKLQSIQSIQRAAVTGISDAAMGAVSQGGKADWLADAYATGRVEGKGDVRLKSIEAAMNMTAKGGANDPNAISARALQKQLAGAKSEAERVGILANAERVMGVTGKSALASTLAGPDLGGLLAKQMRGGFGSIGDENKAFAQAMGFSDSSRTGFSAAASSGVGEQAAGAYLKSESFRDRAADILSGDQARQAAAIKGITSEINEAGEATTDAEKGTRDAKRATLDAAKFAQFMSSKPGGMPTEKEQAAYAKSQGTTLEVLKSKLRGIDGILTARQKTDLAEQSKRVHLRAAGERDQLTLHGVMDAAGGLTAQSVKELGGIGAKDPKTGKTAAQHYAEIALGIVKREEGLTGEGGAGDEKLMGEIMRGGGTEQGILNTMTVEEKRKLAKSLGGEEGARISASAAAQQTFDKRSRKYGGTSAAAAKTLGLDAKEFQKTDLSTTEGAKMLLSKAGLDSEAAEKDVMAAAKGKGGSLADVLRKLTEQMDAKKQDEKRNAEFENSPEGKLQQALKHNSDVANDFLKEMLRTQKALLSTAQKEALDKDPEAPGAPKK